MSFLIRLTLPMGVIFFSYRLVESIDVFLRKAFSIIESLILLDIGLVGWGNIGLICHLQLEFCFK